MRSDWRTREMKTFCPVTTYRRPRLSANVRMRVVSEPASGSVTAKACSRSSPDAIPGRKRRFCSSEPCRSTVPIVYICAWQAAELAPERLISSRMTLASRMPSPIPPYSSGIRHARYPASVSASTNSCGYARASSEARQ